ncbi:MAG: glycosyltransferase family 39 protein [Chloroflexus sp.]|nr:glycosyltransferase family 39 protein [Chloroflexus sp.]
MIIISLSATWLLASRPWQIDAVIGGADSAVVGDGFFTKEQSSSGAQFRWTGDRAIINLPNIQSTYLISFHAYIPDNTPYPITINDRVLPVVTIPLQPGFRTYHVLWRSPPLYHWFDLYTPRRLIFDTEPRILNVHDQRLLGLALSRLHVRGHTLEIPVVPLIQLGLTLIAMSKLLKPLYGARLIGFAVIAICLPLGYDLLVWHPPTADDHTWLPLSWLPGMVMAVSLGMGLAHTANSASKGSFVAAIIVGLLAVAVIATLQWHWRVEGPDYGWHLNHGGSWERVFRAHPFYPFGLPLILWLGQLAGDQALLFGRVAGFVATLFAIATTMLLVWRLIEPSYAWLAGMLMLASPIVTAYGVLVSTDALMAGFCALALLTITWYERLSLRQIVLAGIGIGFAYLFRFQAVVLLIPLLLWLYWQPVTSLPTKLRWLARLGRFTAPSLLIVAFLIASAPQWLLDIRDTGRPFATQQYVNIWLFAFDRTDVVPGTSTIEQLWFILSFDPYTLWRHWLENIREFCEFTVHRLLVWPFGLLAFCGIALIGYLRDRRYVLLLAWVVIYSLVVTITTNKERFYLPIIPPLVVFVIVVLMQISSYTRQLGSRWVFVPICLGALLFYWALIHLPLAEFELMLYGFVRV